MFDLGWQEFLIIAFVLVLVVGPKDLPKVLKTITKFLRQARQMAGEFHKGLETMADQEEIRDVKNSFNEIKNTNFDSIAKTNLDPGGDVQSALNQAKASADLANQKDNVEKIFKEASDDASSNLEEEIVEVEEKKEKSESSLKMDDQKTPTVNL